MKRFFLVTLGVIVVLSIVLAGCAQPSPASKPSQPPTATPAPVSKGPIELKFAHHVAAAAATNTQYLSAWARMVEKATNDGVKIVEFPNETLLKAQDAIQGIEGGIADIEWIVPGYFPGRFIATQVMTLPALHLPLAEKNSRILQELYEKFPSMQAEFKGLKLLHLNASDPFSLFTTKKPVRTLNDIKGMKIRDTNGPYPQKMWERLGASALGVPMPGVYEAAEKGVIDGTSTGWGGMLSFNLYEVFKYWTKNSGNSLTIFAMAMNEKKWNSLPPDIQKGIMSVSGTAGAEFGGAKAFGPGTYPAAQAKMKAGGFKVEEVEFEAAELAKYKEIARSLWDEWVQEVTAKGINGRAILDEAIRLIDKYK